MKIEITLAQIHSEFGKPYNNLKHVLDIIQSIQPLHPHILVLPELWTSGFDLHHTAEHAPADTEILQELTRQAADKNIWIGGSYLTQTNDNYYNTFVLLGPQGEQAVYHKIHLIKLMQEERWFTAGDQYTVVDTGFAKIGLSVCYDLRFPALFQALSHHGSNLMLLPAAWPLPRINHWDLLVHARAVENQCFFAACNAVGGTHRETFGGTSLLVSPWGEDILRFNQNEETIQTATIEMDEVDQLREKFPVLREQKEDGFRNTGMEIIQFTGRDNNTAKLS